MLEKQSRPWQGGGESGDVAARPSHLHSITPGPGRQVYAANGRVVGEVRDGVLRKAVRRSVHFLRKPPAIAWDVACLEQAERLGATRTEILDLESGATYAAPLSAFWRDGIRLNRGHGDQVALPLDRWQVFRKGEPVGVQLCLFGEVGP